MTREEKLLHDLDNTARKFNRVEYGLPIIDGIPDEYLKLIHDYKKEILSNQ